MTTIGWAFQCLDLLGLRLAIPFLHRHMLI